MNLYAGSASTGKGPQESKAKQPCSKCGAETRRSKECGECGTLVVFLPKAKPPLESVVKAEIRKALVGMGGMVMVHNVDNRNLSTGLGKGVSDLVVIVPPSGRFLAIEIKRPGYTNSDVSDIQRAWLSSVREFGGVSGVACCVSEAKELFSEASK